MNLGWMKPLNFTNPRKWSTNFKKICRKLILNLLTAFSRSSPALDYVPDSHPRIVLENNKTSKGIPKKVAWAVLASGPAQTQTCLSLKVKVVVPVPELGTLVRVLVDQEKEAARILVDIVEHGTMELGMEVLLVLVLLGLQSDLIWDRDMVLSAHLTRDKDKDKDIIGQHQQKMMHRLSRRNP
jgi:hypothetical protein